MHSLRGLDFLMRRALIRQATTPVGPSYINRIADTRSGLTYAPIADELEPFEESFIWKVCRMRYYFVTREFNSMPNKQLPLPQKNS